MHGLGSGMPRVERARDRNGDRGRMSEFKANGHELYFGARGVVVVMIVFHRLSFRFAGGANVLIFQLSLLSIALTGEHLLLHRLIIARQFVSIRYGDNPRGFPLATAG